ncbi:MAG: SMI1/KNR4 family protein [Treponema sp.]|nr:SMI1/KNR4 family protein [Treponema sp.]
MKTIKELVEKKFKFYQKKAVSDNVISNAEKELNISLAQDYKDYLKCYGACSFSSHEFTGLGFSGYMNVVSATNEERRVNSNFPKDMYIIENLAIEGVLIVQNSKGEVFEYTRSSINKIYNSFKDYLKSLC